MSRSSRCIVAIGVIAVLVAARWGSADGAGQWGKAISWVSPPPTPPHNVADSSDSVMARSIAATLRGGGHVRGISLRENALVRGANGHVQRKPAARILHGVTRQSQAANPAQTAARQPPRPNIVFVLADQWRAQALGYAGNRAVKTPNLDRLAAESVNFVNAVSACPVCSPTRATLLTGTRPLTHGVFMNDVALNPAAVTFAKVLKADGYDTAYIGKWHIDGQGRSSFIPPERRQGFDYWKVLECTHNYNHSFYYAEGPEKRVWQGYDAIAQTRDAEAYLRGHADSGRPFLLVLSWGPPHAPYQTAPEKYRAMYDPRKIRLRPNVIGYVASQARNDLAGYYAHCTALDDCIGQLRNTIADLGIEARTMFVFTSDHGDLIGSHGAWKKQQPYDESVRVPLLWRYPDVLGSKPRQIDSLISSEDIMPTLLALAGVAIPDQVEGLDYSRAMRGGPDPSDGAALLMCPMPFGQWARRWGGREYRGIRTRRYTYARDLRGPWLLLDNQQDPYQLDNLIGQAEHAELAKRMDAILTRKLKQAGDEFLPGEAYVKKWGYPLDKTGTVPYRN